MFDMCVFVQVVFLLKSSQLRDNEYLGEKSQIVRNICVPWSPGPRTPIPSLLADRASQCSYLQLSAVYHFQTGSVAAQSVLAYSRRQLEGLVPKMNPGDVVPRADKLSNVQYLSESSWFQTAFRMAHNLHRVLDTRHTLFQLKHKFHSTRVESSVFHCGDILVSQKIRP